MESHPDPKTSGAARLMVLTEHLRTDFLTDSTGLRRQLCIGEMEKRVVDEDLENPASRKYLLLPSQSLALTL